jgi:hypothetical protein
MSDLPPADIVPFPRENGKGNCLFVNYRINCL